MKTITVSDFQARLSEYLQSVQRGKSFIVSERGHPVAKLTPLAAGEGEEEWETVLERPGLIRPPDAILPKAFFDFPVSRLKKTF